MYFSLFYTNSGIQYTLFSSFLYSFNIKSERLFHIITRKKNRFHSFYICIVFPWIVGNYLCNLNYLISSVSKGSKFFPNHLLLQTMQWRSLNKYHFLYVWAHPQEAFPVFSSSFKKYLFIQLNQERSLIVACEHLVGTCGI